MIFLLMVLLSTSFLLFYTFFSAKQYDAQKKWKLVLIYTSITTLLGFLILISVYVYYGNKIPEGTTPVTFEQIQNPK